MAWALEDGGPWSYIDRPVTTASGETFVLRYGPTTPRGEATWVLQIIGPDGTDRQAVRYWPRPRAVRPEKLAEWLVEYVHDTAAVDDAVGRFVNTHPWLVHIGT